MDTLGNHTTCSADLFAEWFEFRESSKKGLNNHKSFFLRIVQSPLGLDGILRFHPGDEPVETKGHLGSLEILLQLFTRDKIIIQ